MSSFYFVFKNHLYICRRAKNKLPKEIQKKIEEWKFSSGVLIMCLVAYSDKSPSLSSLSTSLFLLASLDIYFPAWRVLLLLGIPLPTLTGTGRKGCTNILKNGLLNNSAIKIWNPAMRQKFLSNSRRLKTSALRRSSTENLYYPQCKILKQLSRSRG